LSPLFSPSGNAIFNPLIADEDPSGFYGFKGVVVINPTSLPVKDTHIPSLVCKTANVFFGSLDDVQSSKTYPHKLNVTDQSESIATLYCPRAGDKSYGSEST